MCSASRLRAAALRGVRDGPFSMSTRYPSARPSTSTPSSSTLLVPPARWRSSCGGCRQRCPPHPHSR
eukprot:scaffold22819_cov28-Tisochrysis_lutea.AAC.4